MSYDSGENMNKFNQRMQICSLIKVFITHAFYHILDSINGTVKTFMKIYRYASLSGPSCSKLTMSLVNDSLKFTSSDI